MTLDDAIATLYVREINCGCETFWDGGIRVWIGDWVNGHKIETIFNRHHTAPVLDHFPYDRSCGGPSGQGAQSTAQR
jgi:hypothetical protein